MQLKKANINVRKLKKRNQRLRIAESCREWKKSGTEIKRKEFGKEARETKEEPTEMIGQSGDDVDGRGHRLLGSIGTKKRGRSERKGGKKQKKITHRTRRQRNQNNVIVKKNGHENEVIDYVKIDKI